MSFDTGIHGKVESVVVSTFIKPVPFAVLQFECDGGSVKIFYDNIHEIRILANQILAECDRVSPAITEDQRERKPAGAYLSPMGGTVDPLRDTTGTPIKSFPHEGVENKGIQLT
jgi:hypothetical protein